MIENAILIALLLFNPYVILGFLWAASWMIPFAVGGTMLRTL